MEIFGFRLESYREKLGFTVCRPKYGTFTVRVFSLYWPFTWTWKEAML